MAVMTFPEARAAVLQTLRQRHTSPAPETVPLLESPGRVLAETVLADRDFPPFPRSTRDGYAVRCGDLASPPASLRIVGQVKAGECFPGTVRPGECVEIMTGAPVPEGVDAVLMIEHAMVQGDRLEASRSVQPGENIVPRGSEARRGQPLLEAGRRIGYAEIAMMAAVGKCAVRVYRKPRVAILPTGDELVEPDEQPGPYQIRNSNGCALQALVAGAGGTAVPMGIAPDQLPPLREKIAAGLQADLLLLSGGVSAGKFDLVEPVLAEFGAEPVFDGVRMQPGRPLVFGRAGDTFYFGLPGNPLSTMVTFELFVRPCLALLSGEALTPAPFLRARLGTGLRRRAGLTAFLPALLSSSGEEAVVSPVEWKGSGDLASLMRSNCFLVIPEQTAEIAAGEWVAVLPR